MPPIVRHVMSQTDGGRLVRLQAEVYGPLGVTPGYRIPGGVGDPTHDGNWCVTHLATGLAAVSVHSRSDARRIAAHLRDHFAGPFEATTAEGVKSSLPWGVRRWLGLCAQARRWVEPIDGELREDRP